MNNNSRDPPSKILLLVITQLPPTFPLTNDFLHETFKGYGEIKKILIFERGKANKAFVEYYSLQAAVAARKDLNGKLLSSTSGKQMPFMTSPRLIIHFSRLKNLDLEVVDNSRGTDYTQTSSTKSDQLMYSKTDDPNVLRQSSGKAFAQSQRNLTPPRNDEINHLLDSDSDGEIDLSIWRQDALPSLDGQQEIQQLLQQKPSKLLKAVHIDERVTAKMLFNVFNKFGHIEELLYEKKQQRLFVRYQSLEQALLAKEYLNNIMFFDSQLRITFVPVQALQPGSLQDEYMIYYNPNGPKQVMPLSKSLWVHGVQDCIEIAEMFKLVGKVVGKSVCWMIDCKVSGGSIVVTMSNVFEALKIIAVFSDYEYKNQKLQISIK